MPDTKISALTDGGLILPTDQTPVNRSGANVRVGSRISTCRLDATFTPAGTALENVTGMSMPVLSGHYYQGKFHLIIQSTSTTNAPAVAITRPAGGYASSFRLAATTNLTLTTGLGWYEIHSNASGDEIQFADVPGANQNTNLIIEFTYQCTADGNLQLQFAHESGTTACTLRVGSTGFMVDCST